MEDSKVADCAHSHTSPDSTSRSDLPAPTSSDPQPEALQFLETGPARVGVELLLRRVSPCSMTECGGRCCRFGALVDDSQRTRIQAILPRVLPLLRPSARACIRQLGWHFSSDVRERYASGTTQYTATRVVEGTCIFIRDAEQGGCSLHALALEDQVPVSEYKPRECSLFPLNALHEGRVHLHRWSGFPCTADRPDHPPAWRGLEGELSLALGLEAYDALRAQIDALPPEVQLSPFDFPDPPPVPRGRRRKRQDV